MIVLRVLVELTADEAEFLGMKLAELVARAETPIDKFWTIKMQERVGLALQEVKAADAEGRLMASVNLVGQVVGPTSPPPSPPPAPPPVSVTSTIAGVFPGVMSRGHCACGSPPGSIACMQVKAAGKHP